MSDIQSQNVFIKFTPRDSWESVSQDSDGERRANLRRYTKMVSLSTGLSGASASVLLGIYSLETRRGSNIRVEALVDGVSATSFILVIQTWDDCEIISIGVTYCAFVGSVARLDGALYQPG